MVPCWNLFIVGISLLYLVYFNAPIYFVKGGRLRIIPGVLFHSCRPSFRHTCVMFLDFAFVTRLGELWDPNLGFNICHLSLFPLGSADSRVIFILTPPGPVLLRVLVRIEQPTGPPRGNLRSGFTRSLTNSVCPENEVRATPIGICRHIGRLCWSCFTIVEMSCKPGF